MSISTIQQPVSPLVPVYNSNFFVFDSDNKTEENFKYIIDIYWDSTRQTRHLIPPHPDTGYGIINVSKILQSIVSSDLPDASGFSVNTNSMKVFYLKVGEQYSDPLTDYEDDLTTDNFYAVNMELERKIYLQQEATMPEIIASQLFLNNNSNVKLEFDQRAYIYFLLDITNGNIPTLLQIKTYDASNSVLDSADKTISLSAPASGDFLHVSYPIGTLDIADMLTDDTAYYTATLFHDMDAVSATQVFNIVDGSCKYDTKRFHFLNKLGGFDSFNFSLVSKDNFNIEKNFYKKIPFDFSDPEATYPYSTNSRGKALSYVRSEQSMKVTSDWITETEAEWLFQLLTSREIYYDDGADMYAVILKQASYEIKKKQNEKLFNLELEFEYALDKYL